MRLALLTAILTGIMYGSPATLAHAVPVPQSAPSQAAAPARDNTAGVVGGMLGEVMMASDNKRVSGPYVGGQVRLGHSGLFAVAFEFGWTSRTYLNEAMPYYVPLEGVRTLRLEQQRTHWAASCLFLGRVPWKRVSLIAGGGPGIIWKTDVQSYSIQGQTGTNTFSDTYVAGIGTVGVDVRVSRRLILSGEFRLQCRLYNGESDDPCASGPLVGLRVAF
jgi:hypothetical protein